MNLILKTNYKRFNLNEDENEGLKDLFQNDYKEKFKK